MRLLLVGSNSSQHVHNWARWFVDQGHEVRLLTYGKKKVDIFGVKQRRILFLSWLVPIYKDKPSPLQEMPKKGGEGTVSERKPGDHKFLKLMKNLVEGYHMSRIKGFKPDVVHALYISNYGPLACKIGVRPVFMTALGSDIALDPLLSKAKDRNVRFALKNADIVHTGDEEGRKRLLELGCDPKKIIIKIWGVDVERFSPETSSEELRQKILGEKGKAVVLCAHAQKEYYNTPDLLRAVPLVAEKRKDVIYVIAGDGELLDKNKALAKELGVSDMVKFVGAVKHEDMPSYYASSDIFVDPFYSDVSGGGIGVAVMEAMSSGIPVLAARRNGLETAIREGENGFMFEHGNSAGLAENILWLLDRPDELRSFGQAGRSFALENGNMDKTMREFEEMYKNAAQQGKI